MAQLCQSSSAVGRNGIGPGRAVVSALSDRRLAGAGGLAPGMVAMPTQPPHNG